ncbi:MAG: exodeoxyribonuclease VII small subunit [Nostocoides sp.]
MATAPPHQPAERGSHPVGAPPDGGGAETAQNLNDIHQLGYEAAKAELVDLAARLEGGQVGLEESMAMWQRAQALAAHCEAWLTRAEEAFSPTSSDS